MPTKRITRAIWLLSFVSLLADLSSQMLYPILPLQLRSIGFSVVLIAVLEGIAEVTAGLSNGYFSRRSDRPGRRLPFVRVGYTLSALAKPLTGLLAGPVGVFVARTADRFGKGLRTTARDGLLADASDPQSRAEVFGVHRSLNWLGAVLGPLAALVYLSVYPGEYGTLFMLAFAPGLLSAGLTFLLTDRISQSPAPPTALNNPPVSLSAFRQYWRESPPEYRQVMGGLLVFSLLKSSDVFLLLKMKAVGLDDTVILGLYVFYNLVYAGLANPIGRLTDRIGLKSTLLIGLVLFALVYEGMAIADHLPVIVGLLALYGLYAAATEGSAKAWISTISGPWHTTAAVGTYAGLSSVGAFVANILAGVLWYAFGPTVLFAATGMATLWVIMYLASAEGLPRGVVAVRKPGVVITTDGDLTGSDNAPYVVENQPLAVPLTWPASLALTLLMAGLSIGTIYTSYVAISTVLRSPASLTAGSEPADTDRSGFSPSTMTTRPITTQRLTNPAESSTDNPSGSNPPNGSSLPGETDLVGLYDGTPSDVTSSSADRSEVSPLTVRSATRQRRANPIPAANSAHATASSDSPNGPNQSGKLGLDNLSSITQFLTAKRPPVPWLEGAIRPIHIRGLSANTSAEKLAGRLSAKVIAPRFVERRPVRLYTVAALYTHVYERPTKRSRKKPFLNIGKKVVLTALMEKNGFIYVVYSTRKGQMRKGWLPKRAVRVVRLPTDLYSS